MQLLQSPSEIIQLVEGWAAWDNDQLPMGRLRSCECGEIAQLSRPGHLRCPPCDAGCRLIFSGVRKRDGEGRSIGCGLGPRLRGESAFSRMASPLPG